MLSPGEKRSYDLEVGMLESAEQIQSFRDQIEKLRKTRRTQPGFLPTDLQSLESGFRRPRVKCPIAVGIGIKVLWPSLQRARVQSGVAGQYRP